MKSTMYFGNPCQSSILSTLTRSALPAATPAATPALDLKPFLPFPLDSARIGFLPNFSTAVVGLSGTEPGSALRSWKAGLVSKRVCMDPIRKAIMSQTLGLPPPTLKSKHLISCALCQLKFNSENQASAHFKGTRHARKLRILEAPDARRQPASVVAKETARKDSPKRISPSDLPASSQATACRNGAVSPPTTAEPTSDSTPLANCSAPGEAEGEVGEETEEEKAKRLLYCNLCKVAVNSASQLEAHNSGTKHKTMLEARSGGGAIKSFPRQGVKCRLASPTTSATGLQNKTFICEICDVHVNSETQLKQHISSRRHKDRAAGKPAKPKYSPYSKSPSARTPNTLPVRLAKPLPAQLIPGHVTTARVPSISLSPAPALAAALFQTQNLLRHAPGPLRTAPTPVLFTPY